MKLNELLRTTEILDAEKSFWTVTKLRTMVGLIVLTMFAGVTYVIAGAPIVLTTAGVSAETNKWWNSLPHNLGTVRAPSRTILLDRNGEQFAQLYTENRSYVKFDQISKNVIDALIATEDSRFYQHKGMDPKGIARAIINNVVNNKVQGASTITQQLIENMRVQLADNDPKKLREAKARSIVGKLQEVRLAEGIESNHSKNEILESYLNLVYFGNRAYGIQAAAQKYFNVNASDLTIDQAATLIAMMKSPIAYDPITQPEASRVRRDVVMKRMVEVHMISAPVYEQLKAQPTTVGLFKQSSSCADSKYPYYCAMVSKAFINDPIFGSTKEDRVKRWNKGGMIIKTALDPKAMNLSRKAVFDALGENNRIVAGIAMITPGNGEVVGIAQNRIWGQGRNGNFRKTEMVYPDTIGMQIGSTFKPITAATALEEGFSADTLLDSPSPAHFKGFDEPSGGFKNDDRVGHGVINISTALKFSVNTFFVGLLNQVGVKDTAAMARRLGMTSVPANLTGREGSLTLGTYESSPVQLASVYATFAGRGIACKPVTMLQITDIVTGDEIPRPDGDCHQEISPQIADTMANLMQAPFTKGGTASKLGLNGRKAAGKTGTTDDAAATWFAGFTPQLATAVWVGDPRGGTKYPVRDVSAFGTFFSTVWGSSIAGPVWKNVMNEYHAGIPASWFPAPGGVSVALATRRVPNVTGLHVDEGITLLLQNGFKVSIAEKTQSINDNVTAKNIIVRSVPSSGDKAAYGDTIKLILSDGSDVKMSVPGTIQELQGSVKQ